MQMACKAFSLTLSATMQIYCDKKKARTKEKNSTPTVIVWDTKMAQAWPSRAVYCYFDTNMAELTSCEKV